MPTEREISDPRKAKEVIKKNAETSSEWPYAPEAQFLNRLAVILRDEVIDPVALVSRERMPDPVIGFMDAGHKDVLAYYNTVYDAYGFPDQIIFNTHHYTIENGIAIYKYPRWTQAEILCHEETHLYFNHLKHIDGRKRVTHGVEFVEKCRQMGLYVVPIYGAHYQVADYDSPFGRIMKELGIQRPEDVPRGDDDPLPKRDYWRPTKEKGKSSLNKWVCTECGMSVNYGRKDDPQLVHEPCGTTLIRAERGVVYKSK